MTGLSPSAWLALSLMYRCLLARKLEKGLENIPNEAEGVCGEGLLLSWCWVWGSRLELGTARWGALLAPLPTVLAPAGGFCALPAPGPLSRGWGNRARHCERFLVGADGMSKARAWPGQGLYFSSPVGERLKLSAYSCFVLFFFIKITSTPFRMQLGPWYAHRD